LLLNKYFEEIDELLKNPLILSINLKKDHRSSYVGLLSGEILFINNSTLYFMEYLEVNDFIEKKTYRYHYQDGSGNLIFRYDNAPHHKEIVTFPHHKHTDKKIFESVEQNLASVLSEIQVEYLLKK